MFFVALVNKNATLLLDKVCSDTINNIKRYNFFFFFLNNVLVNVMKPQKGHGGGRKNLSEGKKKKN